MAPDCATESSARQQPKIAFTTPGSKSRFVFVEITAKQAFARRLIEAMLDRSFHSARNAKSGVDVGPLAKAAKVTREMARRYTEGGAIPDLNKMKLIANWLEVRLPWLRDGEGQKRDDAAGAVHLAAQPEGTYLTEAAIEIARVFMKLPTERQEWFRDLMCLEAAIATHYPWLIFGRPRRESYDQYEKRVERDLLRRAEGPQK